MSQTAILYWSLGLWALVWCFVSLVILASYKFTNRCIHAWQLVDKTELPSGLEMMHKSGISSCYLYHGDIPKMAKRTIILALRCDKCGVAKIFRES